MKRFLVVSQLPPNSLFRAWDQANVDPALPDAIALLTADHRIIENLLAAFAHARGLERRRRLIHQVCAALRFHAHIEEEILLPALRGRVAASAIDAAQGGHARVRALIAAIEGGDEDLKAVAEEIIGLIEAEEAPRTGLFSRARTAGIDLVALRDAIMARKAAEAEPMATVR